MNRINTSIAIATVLLVGAGAPAGAQHPVAEEIARQVTREVRQQVTHQTTAQAAREAAQQITQDVVREVSRAVQVAKTAGVTAVNTGQRGDFKFEQKAVETKKLAIGPTGDISLRNIVGDITVKAGGGSEATVEIIRISRGRTETDAKAGLEEVTVETMVRGERATVETRYPNQRRPNFAVSVSYNVTAPAGAGVSINTVSGDLSVTGLKGEVAVKAISGKIDLNGCSHVSSVNATSGHITLTNVQSAGDMEVEGISAEVRLTGVKARRLVAGIVSGTITAGDIQVEGASVTTMSGDITYSGSVAPKGRYEFKAHSGTVKLGLTGGFDLEAKTFSGNVDTDPALGIAKPTGRGMIGRTITGTTGNGGASVIATTFSGTVWVGKSVK